MNKVREHPQSTAVTDVFVDVNCSVGANPPVRRLLALLLLVAVVFVCSCSAPRAVPQNRAMNKTADQEQILAPSRCGRARFGATLAVDGPYLVIGATARDSSEGLAEACLYDHRHWNFLAALTNTRTGTYAGFSDAMAISAQLGVIAINSPGYEIGDGPVHVFESDRAWIAPRFLTNPDDPQHAAETYWADGLAFVGSDLAIGNALLAGATPTTSGAVLIYANASGTPQVLRPSTDGHDEFGRALGADGDLLAVGAPAANQFAGRVDIFQRVADRYSEIARLVPQTPSPQGEFGATLVVAGKLVVVGTPHGDGTVRAAGKVDVFEHRGSTFTHLATISSPDPREDGWFGRSIACDGRRLAIGEPGGPGRRGRVWRFELGGGAVRSLGKWEPQELVDDEWFGAAVALGPEWLAAGAPSSTASQRFGRVFVRDWP